MWTKCVDILARLDGGWSEGRYWKLTVGALLIGEFAIESYRSSFLPPSALSCKSRSYVMRRLLITLWYIIILYSLCG